MIAPRRARKQEPAVRGDGERLKQPQFWIDLEKLLWRGGGKMRTRSIPLQERIFGAMTCRVAS